MSAVFIKILNMSINASWIILAVILTRFLLKRAPKWIVCALWALVSLRLALPVSFKSSVSAVPSAETIPQNITVAARPQIHSGINMINSAVNPGLSASLAPSSPVGASPVEKIMTAGAVVWLVGVAVMLVYALVSYIRLKKTVAASVGVGGRVMACDEVRSPFILGVLKPKIYVPSSLSGDTLKYVISHEEAHLKRRDHLWKPLGYLILAVYWFNPLVWIAYVLLCRDIEAACDEKVIRDLDKDGVASYSQALLECSAPRRIISACPVAFGEVGVKQRIKGVLNYKKPAFWIIIAAVIASVVIAVTLLTDPPAEEKNKDGWYKIEYDLGDTEKDFIQMPKSAKAGDEVRITTKMLIDADIHVYVDGQELGQTCLEVGNWMYTFVMPEGDVLVTARFYTKAEIWGGNTDIDTLKDDYPGYFGLDTTKGLEVFVWQMARGSYSFGLTSGTNREKTLEELMSLKGATAAEMSAILSTYDIDSSDISIIPWQNPISSYISEYFIVYQIDDAASAESRRRDYVENVRNMLFGVTGDEPHVITDFQTYAVYAGYTDDPRAFACLNSDKLIINSQRHLPVYKIDTAEDLARFKEDFAGVFALDQGYDEVPSFNDVTSSFDESFFEERTLVIAYVQASSGSYRYDIQDVETAGDYLCLDVVPTNRLGDFTDDEAGWLVVAEFADTDIADITEFDAKITDSDFSEDDVLLTVIDNGGLYSETPYITVEWKNNSNRIIEYNFSSSLYHIEDGNLERMTASRDIIVKDIEFNPGSLWITYDLSPFALEEGEKYRIYLHSLALGDYWVDFSVKSPAQDDVTFWFNSRQAINKYSEIAIEGLPGTTVKYNTRLPGIEVTNGDTKKEAAFDSVDKAYFCNLNGDGIPELCMERTVGSGVLHYYVWVYDIANDSLYEATCHKGGSVFSFYGSIDFELRESDGQLYVDARDYYKPDEVISERLSFSGEKIILESIPDYLY